MNINGKQQSKKEMNYAPAKKKKDEKTHEKLFFVRPFFFLFHKLYLINNTSCWIFFNCFIVPFFLWFSEHSI